MADARDTAAPKVESIVNSPPLPTASDICRQITANALVLFPNIVQNHITKFSNIPVRAQNIFDVCVANVTDQYSSEDVSEDASEDASKYTAKLTHAHMEYPAARMLLLSGRAMPTMRLALHGLLERCAEPLGTSLDTLLPMRDGCAEDTDGPRVHKESAIMGFKYAEEVRQMAMDFDMGKEPTPLSGSDE